MDDELCMLNDGQWMMYQQCRWHETVAPAADYCAEDLHPNPDWDLHCFGSGFRCLQPVIDLQLVDG